MTSRLPAEFSVLEPYALQWDLHSANERRSRRLQLQMSELQEFYDAVLPHAERAMAYIEQFPIGSAPEQAQALLRLLLGLAHAAMSVELHRQHCGPNAPESDSLKVTGDFWLQ
jgi:hypothetical protein